MHKILVTGANGFIGAALCEKLKECEISFVSAVRKKVASHQFQINDLTYPVDWSQALSGCDTVIHLAARVHVMHDTSINPAAAYKAINVDATLHLAKQAVQCGVKRFVYLSSIKVNGEETTGRPYTASDMPLPIDPYGQSKLEAEIALKKLSNETGLEVVIIRPPLVYGPRVQANFLKLIKIVKWQIPLPFGAIHNRRSMVALDNLVDLLIVCSQHPNASGQIFMVSDDSDVSITELLKILARAMKKRAFLLPIPAPLLAGTARLFGKTAVMNRLTGSLQVDITHTKSTLNWKPPVSMQKALEKTVSHFLAQP
ncbi:MAG: UDP-glucose 4-epimerase family protein [Burkholderiaceae bacterium]